MSNLDPKVIIFSKLAKLAKIFSEERRKEDGTIVITVFETHLILRTLAEIIDYLKKA